MNIVILGLCWSWLLNLLKFHTTLIYLHSTITFQSGTFKKWGKPVVTIYMSLYVTRFYTWCRYSLFVTDLCIVQLTTILHHFFFLNDMNSWLLSWSDSHSDFGDIPFHEIGDRGWHPFTTARVEFGEEITGLSKARNRIESNRTKSNQIESNRIVCQRHEIDCVTMCRLLNFQFDISKTITSRTCVLFLFYIGVRNALRSFKTTCSRSHEYPLFKWEWSANWAC